MTEVWTYYVFSNLILKIFVRLLDTGDLSGLSTSVNSLTVGEFSNLGVLENMKNILADFYSF